MSATFGKVNAIGGRGKEAAPSEKDGEHMAGTSKPVNGAHAPKAPSSSIEETIAKAKIAFYENLADRENEKRVMLKSLSKTEKINVVEAAQRAFLTERVTDFALQELKQEKAAEVKKELKKELRENVLEELKVELKDEAMKKLMDENKEAVVQDLTEKLRPVVEELAVENCYDVLRPSVEKKMRSELKDSVTEALIKELRDSVYNEKREEVERQVQKRVETEVREKLESSLQLRVAEQLKVRYRPQVMKELREELEDTVRREIHEDHEPTIRHDLESALWEQINEEQRPIYEAEVRRRVEDEIRHEQEQRERSPRQYDPTTDPFRDGDDDDFNPADHYGQGWEAPQDGARLRGHELLGLTRRIIDENYDDADEEEERKEADDGQEEERDGGTEHEEDAEIRGVKRSRNHEEDEEEELEYIGSVKRAREDDAFAAGNDEIGFGAIGDEDRDKDNGKHAGGAGRVKEEPKDGIRGEAPGHTLWNQARGNSVHDAIDVSSSSEDEK